MARGLCLAMLALLLAAGLVLSLGVGAVGIAPTRVLEALGLVGGSGIDETDATIVWHLRLPRVLLAALVGGGLGAAGAGYQGLFRNPLADPFVVGASSGAALGATLAIVGRLEWSFWELGPVPLSALAGAWLAVTLVYSLASIGRQVPTLSLLLSGVAVSSFLGAMVSLLMFLNDEKLATILGWLMGSLSGRGWPMLQATAPLIAIGGVLLWFMSRSLDALTFGEEAASSLGLRLTRLRAVVLFSASLATAASVAAGGIIGFVGLIAPHIARLLVGARHAYVIPASALLGALLLLAADDLARVVAAPAELPVGVMTALLGSPFFLYLLKTRQRELGTP